MGVLLFGLAFFFVSFRKYAIFFGFTNLEVTGLQNSIQPALIEVPPV